MSGRDKLADTLNRIAELAESIAAPLGMCIVDVRFGQAGKRRTLEVTIHRRNGTVGLDDCETISRALEQKLDEKAESDNPLIEGAYMLEVQSPGIDRLLKTEREFRAFTGQVVLVQTKAKVSDLGDRFTGTLSGIESDDLVLTGARAYPAKQQEGAREKVVVTRSDVINVKLCPEKDLDQSASSKGRSHDRKTKPNN